MLTAKLLLSFLFLIRYLKFMLKRRTASAGFFSQSGTIKTSIQNNIRCLLADSQFC
ncbi:hypothetical protein [Candidatus Tisiphia endosymbiont of Parasteatoda lunata]|uniref:hypothetical protein n=1 Tax=Candidatus Tisiphia endosymbiont of Parasteatoda lunata TaxID=3066275 RepID=UPI00313B572A